VSTASRGTEMCFNHKICHGSALGCAAGLRCFESRDKMARLPLAKDLESLLSKTFLSSNASSLLHSRQIQLLVPS
jgi:hypothetical protein